MSSGSPPVVAVLGASGLIGQAIAEAVLRENLPLAAFARRLVPHQANLFRDGAVIAPFVELSDTSLADQLARRGVDVVVNCVGALQDSARGATGEVHRDFVARLLLAIAAQPKPVLLIHVSIPGHEAEDATAFSLTKREGERLIASSGGPYAILRPGFVIAPAAFGGSALMRGLAATPFALPDDLAAKPFAAATVGDIARTVTVLARRWQAGERDVAVVWDVMERVPSTVGEVLAGFRRRFGGPAPRFRLPDRLLGIGARAGDFVSGLGWSPPVRSTALTEMKRGVEGDPSAWIAATGLEPPPLREALATLPATVQERWFARLFLAKPLIVGSLVCFWCVSGLIALVFAFAPATAILTSSGIPPRLAWLVTVVSSLADIAVGLGIAWRRTCRAALAAGIGISLFYMASAAVLTPWLWIEPLGALVKTFPAIVLMVCALLVLDSR